MDSQRRIVMLLDELTLEETKEINFNDIKKDDKFRLYDDDETVVQDKNGDTIFIALEDAHDGQVYCTGYLEWLAEELENLK